MGFFEKRKRVKDEKEIQEYIQERMKDLAEIKKSVAQVNAEVVKSERRVMECEVQIERFQGLAEQAVAQGNEADARVFLKRKYELQQQLETLQAAHKQLSESAEKIMSSHDAMVREINDLRSKLELLKSRETASDVQETVYGKRKRVDVDETLADWEDDADERAARAEAKEYISKSEEEILSEEIERLRKKDQDQDGE